MTLLFDITPLKTLRWVFIKENYQENVILKYHMKPVFTRVTDVKAEPGIRIFLTAHLASKIDHFCTYTAYIDYKSPDAETIDLGCSLQYAQMRGGFLLKNFNQI